MNLQKQGKHWEKNESKIEKKIIALRKKLIKNNKELKHYEGRDDSEKIVESLEKNNERLKETIRDYLNSYHAYSYSKREDLKHRDLAAGRKKNLKLKKEK